mmetsp:Transcript_8289/g.13572  ORF Transcript_8289/g.13572 Transcript_8289/m.13572 type:complete len:492 (-) Transcript_8289:171-1646(-)|eukprot:CAMPEP_0197050240 /NCGR_PEP_ID=MMETSP1384-20130603/25170_1 /TAXON_ID=29189 /ORGANISM="Ammonia sp." /LENGTH=491 /DNA_ID=CAMNT_0042482617 /DNA_START=1814 /DNA_END=3289 /DNA_ORIENTATION=+
MASIFKSSVNKTVDSLAKHLDALLSDDEDKKQKAITKLSDDISQIHFILYGDPETDPKPEQITKLVPKLLQPDTDLFCKLAQFTSLFEFEAKKQTAGIMNYIIRRCSKYDADKYIKSKTDKHGHNVIIDCLLRGYHDQHLAQNVGSVLQEMAKRPELAPMLLNEIRITRKKGKEPEGDEKDNDAQTQAEGDDQEMEERQVVDELFVLVQKQSFDIASDAHKTLQLLLTRNKKLVPKYLEENYEKFFDQFNQLIQSDNYVTQRQFLNLLSELLLEKTNFNLMIKYIGQKENLRIAMVLLKNESNAISHEAFHIFKVFVANPKKARDIHIVLWKNKEKLITFLQNFLPEKAKEDEAFAEEKKIVIKHLEELPIPEEIELHRQRKASKARAKSQGTALLHKDTKSASGPHKSKSIPNVMPHDGANNDDNYDYDVNQPENDGDDASQTQQDDNNDSNNNNDNDNDNNNNDDKDKKPEEQPSAADDNANADGGDGN